MRISLDFDATYTADPELWEHFVAHALARGHDVRIVTARYANADRWDVAQWKMDGNTDIELAAQRMGIPIIYCDMVQKQDVWGADVWIDDSPHMVVGKSQARYLMAVMQDEDNEKLTGFGRTVNMNESLPEDPHLA